MRQPTLVVSLLMAIAVCGTESACAQEKFCPVYATGERFCDDFRDGNATDGMPGTWVPGAQPDGTRDASSGAFVVTHSDVMSTRLQELTGIQDLSIRAQLTFTQTSESDDALLLWARSPDSSPAAYAGGIGTNGLLAIVYTDGNGLTEYLASETSSLNPVDGDVIIEFDVFGTRLSLTAWQDGEPKPTTPQLSVMDNRLTDGGEIGFTLSPSFTFGDGTASASLRYYAVVPAPSASIIALGMLGALPVARRTLRVCYTRRATR